MRGYHVYQDIWEAAVGEMLVFSMEPHNTYDQYAVAVEKNDIIIGHLHAPRKVVHVWIWKIVQIAQQSHLHASWIYMYVRIKINTNVNNFHCFNYLFCRHFCVFGSRVPTKIFCGQKFLHIHVKYFMYQQKAHKWIQQ